MASRNLSSVMCEQRERRHAVLHMCSNCYMEGREKKEIQSSVFWRKKTAFFFFLDWMGALSFSSSVFDRPLCALGSVTDTTSLPCAWTSGKWVINSLIGPPPPPPRQGSPWWWLQREAAAASWQADPESKMEQKWFSCLSLVFWIHVEKNVAPCVEVDLCCMACRGGGVGGADHVERCSIEAHARILRFFLFFYCWLVRSDISFSPDPMSNHARLHPAFGSHLVVGNFSTVLLTLSLPSWSVADSFFFLSPPVLIIFIQCYSPLSSRLIALASHVILNQLHLINHRVWWNSMVIVKLLSEIQKHLISLVFYSALWTATEVVYFQCRVSSFQPRGQRTGPWLKAHTLP